MFKKNTIEVALYAEMDEHLGLATRKVKSSEHQTVATVRVVNSLR